MEHETGGVDGVKSPPIVFSELSGENSCEMTGNNNGWIRGGDWCRDIVPKDGVDRLSLLTECSVNSKTGFVILVKGNGCGIFSTIGGRR